MDTDWVADASVRQKRAPRRAYYSTEDLSSFPCPFVLGYLSVSALYPVFFVALLMSKDALRSAIGDALRLLPPHKIRQKSSRIAGFVSSLSWWHESDVVLAFRSLTREVQTDALLDAALREEKQLGLPRLVAGELRFHRVANVSLDLTRGSYGIEEPKPELPEITLRTRIIALVPGLAFTASGARLGRGGGYYDRFLQAYGHAVTAVGLCFDLQLREELPTEEGDMAVDYVVTESGVVRCDDRGETPAGSRR
jgi:5-formyltetrahydrofolate cyclo-ligase